MDTNNDHNPAGPRNSDTYNIPAMYRAPTVHLQEHELRELERRGMQHSANTMSQGGFGGPKNPRKQLYIVSFKCSRVDVFYLLDNTGLVVREGDLVIVEADRGQDLGTVQHANVTQEEARMLKKKYSEEQYKWLMMYSRNKDGGYNPNAQMHGEQQQLFPDAPTTMQGTIPRDTFNNLKPKAIKRLANDHEVKMLAEKEGNEAKAKRTCQQKVSHLRLQMEILDAEWQWDFQKLIFYYYADHYINFKDLITELYRIYKTRIWLSAINPASFSQHAMGSPPSGIGPGAVPPYALNNGYTMAYGEDRDPYGAQMPYRIPYETYNPNFPSIPGVANSFAPAAYGAPYDYYGGGAPAATLPAGGGVGIGTGAGQRGGVPYDPRQEMLFFGRSAGNEEYNHQQALRANDSDDASAAGPFADNSHASGAPGAAVRRPSAVLPPPIGTRRASQAEDFGVPAGQQRQRQPQFPSPFRNADPGNRFFGREGLFHAAPTHSNGNGNGDGYRAAPNTTVFAGSPLTEQPQYFLGRPENSPPRME